MKQNSQLKNIIVHHFPDISKTVAPSKRAPGQPQTKQDLKNPDPRLLPTAKWIEILHSTPWTHEIGINPRSPYLDESSIQTLLNDYILLSFQMNLFGWKCIKRKANNHLKYPNEPRANFILFPEFDHENGYWHAHGYALIETKKNSDKFLNKADSWASKATMKHFFDGKSLIPTSCCKPLKEGETSQSGFGAPITKVVPRPTSKIDLITNTTSRDKLVNYSVKGWKSNFKIETACISWNKDLGRSHSDLNYVFQRSTT